MVHGHNGEAARDGDGAAPALVNEAHAVGVTTERVGLAKQRRQKRAVFVPLGHHPGRMAVVDFFEVHGDIAGRRHDAWMLLICLMRSGRDFVWLYEHADQIALLNSLVCALPTLAACQSAWSTTISMPRCAASCAPATTKSAWSRAAGASACGTRRRCRRRRR